MSLYRRCVGDFLYYDQVADTNIQCEVRISEEEIVVSYVSDGQPVIYRGPNDPAGHFEMRAPEVDGRASLHRFHNGNILEGYWEEGRMRGMWRIRLA